MRKYLIPFLLLVLVGCATYSNKLEKHIELEGNPTTGYLWVNTIEIEGIVNLKEEILAPKNGLVGGHSIFRYTLIPLSVGNTYINFEYMRPWEGNPISRKRFLVTVSKDGMDVVEVN